MLRVTNTLIPCLFLFILLGRCDSLMPKTTLVTQPAEFASSTLRTVESTLIAVRQATTTSVNQASATALVPSPIKDWSGLRRPDYDTMYNQFTIDLHCDGSSVGMDYGVYGYYSWIEHLTVICGNVATGITLDKAADENYKFWAVTHGLLSFAYNMIRTGVLLKSLADCHNAENAVLGRGLYPITPVIIFTDVSVAGWAVAAMGAFVVTMNRPLGYTAIFPSFALFYVFFSNAMFYYSYTNFLYIDINIYKPVLAVSIPLLVVLVIVFVISFMTGRWDGGLGLIFLGSILCFFMWSVGMGRILLGRTVNDVWGAYALRSALNIAQLVLGVAFPVLSVGTAILVVAGQ